MARKMRSVRGRLVSALLVGLLSLGGGTGPVQPAAAQKVETSGAKKQIEDGIAAYQAGNYDQAISQLSQARTVMPTHSSVVLYLGLAYLRKENPKEALAVWQGYSNLQPYTDVEKQGDLQTLIPQYLTILIREENRRVAREAVANEQRIGIGDPRTVAVTYYRNLGSPELAPLSKGLTALLISDLAKVKELKVVERDLLQALLDEMQLSSTGIVRENAPKVGRLLGAGKVATGSYRDPAKEEVEVNSILAESTAAAPLGEQKARGKVNQFYELEKGLAFAILKDLGYDEGKLRAAGVYDAIGKPQTVSVSALTAFSNGLDAKDRGDFAAARAQFDQALAADPNFEEARRERDKLPLVLLTLGGVIAAVESSVPSSTAATTGMTTAATTTGISTTAVVVGAVAVVGAGVGAGVAVSGGGGGDGPKCGDDKINGDDQCDRANLNSQTCQTQGFGPGGTLTCGAPGSAQACRFDTSGCNPCGNGNKIDSGEACDGTNLNNQTCETQGFGPGGTLACGAPGTAQACRFDTSGCNPCGNNNQIDSGEACDGTNLNNQTCQTQGFGPGGALTCGAPGSAQACQFDTSGCGLCGNNNQIDSGEDCDGTNLGNATCQSLGFGPGGTLQCVAAGTQGQCRYDTSGCNPCGNGRRDSGEICDVTVNPSGCQPNTACIPPGQDNACQRCCGWASSLISCSGHTAIVGEFTTFVFDSVTIGISNECLPLQVTQVDISIVSPSTCPPVSGSTNRTILPPVGSLTVLLNGTCSRSDGITGIGAAIRVTTDRGQIETSAISIVCTNTTPSPE